MKHLVPDGLPAFLPGRHKWLLGKTHVTFVIWPPVTQSPAEKEEEGGEEGGGAA